ncbi:MAG: hypothetical protein EA378_03395 [Phycisphaerales bacterium]|nr:MAG: hypothetical protein EA378_03395 [Phycisphaerales bacterium]
MPRDREQPAEPRARRWFEPAELVCVLSRYDLGPIDAIRPYPRGSALAPKAVLRAATGRYLLKRREPVHADPYRVAVCHAVQLRLADRGFPVAALVGTAGANNSICQHSGGVYELFEFISGKRSDRTAQAARDAGACLAAMHDALRDFEPEWEPARETYHAAPWLAKRFLDARRRLGPDADDTLRTLEDAYRDAAARVDAAGLAEHPPQMIHGDWHPGNLIVARGSIAAVVDFDATRAAPALVDVARGAVNFALDRDDTDGLTLDDQRFAAFCTGYERAGGVLTRAAEALPGLVAENIVAEAIEPVAATGRFGPRDGLAFLRMVAERLDALADAAHAGVRRAAG